jgi:hypothetical protein
MINSALVVRKATEVISFPDLEWDTGSIGFVEKMILGQLLIVAQPGLVVEIGTFRGRTTKFVCEFLKKNQLAQCRIAAFDLPQVIQEIRTCDPYFASQDNVELVGGVLPFSLRKYLEASRQMVGLAIVDANHSYKGVLGDLEAVAPHMKPGGYIFAHDYRKDDSEYAGLIAAVDRFATMHGFAMLPLDPGNLAGREVWGSALLRKPDPNPIPLSSHVYLRTVGKAISQMERAVSPWVHRYLRRN